MPRFPIVRTGPRREGPDDSHGMWDPYTPFEKWLLFVFIAVFVISIIYKRNHTTSKASKPSGIYNERYR